MSELMKRVTSFALTLLMCVAISVTAFADSNPSTECVVTSYGTYVVTEHDGVRTVSDQRTGDVFVYDLNSHILQCTVGSEYTSFDLDDYVDTGVQTRASASSDNNEFAYSSSGNPPLWTLQIPDQVKFTYERNQSALIDTFCRNVDSLIEAEDDLILNYGAAALALASLIASVGNPIALILGVLGAGVDALSVLSKLNTINNCKQTATDTFNEIYTYSTP